ncbi:MAG: DUF4129 domain-containing protein [Planctomycetes bacterium]|nr:DUF4129 domain-containing protein [Planctomycetota bacterium]
MPDRDDHFLERSEPIVETGALAGFFKVLMYAVIGLAAGALLFAILLAVVRWARNHEKKEKKEKKKDEKKQDEAKPEAAAEAVLALAPEGWEELAARLAAEGKHRDAVRAVYHAVLSGLHRRQEIDYRVTLSNWDYVAMMPQGVRRGAFAEATRSFDLVWYGLRSCGEAEYGASAKLAREILGSGDAAA